MRALFLWLKYCMRFGLHTLVDITETNARRVSRDNKEFQQQQNLLTVLQTIGLRVNPTYVSAPKVFKEIPSKLGLGKEYKTKQNVWEFVFDIEYENALDIETLQNDFNLIPIITGLDETIKFKNAVFISQNSSENIVFFCINDK